MFGVHSLFDGPGFESLVSEEVAVCLFNVDAPWFMESPLALIS